MRKAGSRRWCALLLLAASLGWAQTPAPPAPVTDLKPTVILISIDGYRWDYPDLYPSPNIQSLVRGGVRAEMIPSFPTKTFPNHYTLVTGLYPGTHGIVANNMWDDTLQARFTMSNRAAVTDARWWGGEPIWVTARKHGQKAAAMFWPGSEAPIAGHYPDYWQQFDDHKPHAERIAWLLEKLDLPAEQRPTFATLYFSDVDHAGHDFGPGADEVRQAVLRVDAALGDLITGLRARGIFAQVNLIVTADHGMASVTNAGRIFLDDYVDLDTVQVVDWSPVLAIKAKDGDHEALLHKLKQAPHLSLYRKRELPARYHYSQHPRITPLVGVADPGWNITTRKRAAARKTAERGTHGYDPALRDMHAAFLAHGPNFKPGAKLKPFENVHVYSAMAHILGLKPARNDGHPKVLKKVLRRPALGAAAAR